jgi:hydrogenase expression/formation protein HypC
MCLAIPGEVTATRERHGMRFADVQFGGITREVCLEYQPAAQVGDFVLVHVGFAISTIDRDEAARTWEILRELGEDAP